MDSSRPNEVVPPGEVASFVRFCYHRRRAGWPELYDEMCAVAARRLYNGWGFAELADHGIGFSLFETPALASLAREIVREEAERRLRHARSVSSPAPRPEDGSPMVASAPAIAAAPEAPLPAATSPARAVEREVGTADQRAESSAAPRFRLAGATVG
jgi:hypothetical protein